MWASHYVNCLLLKQSQDYFIWYSIKETAIYPNIEGKIGCISFKKNYYVCLQMIYSQESFRGIFNHWQSLLFLVSLECNHAQGAPPLHGFRFNDLRITLQAEHQLFIFVLIRHSLFWWYPKKTHEFIAK